MAYFTQEMKKEKSPLIKMICNKYGIKATLGVRDSSTFVVNINSGVIDFFEGEDRKYSTLNVYHYDNHYENKPVAVKFLTELMAVVDEGNHNNSDVMTDYFDVGFYITINIGKWDKPYVLIDPTMDEIAKKFHK